jgi:hypothetical protein
LGVSVLAGISQGKCPTQSTVWNFEKARLGLGRGIRTIGHINNLFKKSKTPFRELYEFVGVLWSQKSQAFRACRCPNCAAFKGYVKIGKWKGFDQALHTKVQPLETKEKQKLTSVVE